MQESTRDIIVVERSVDRVRRQHARERQVAAGDAFRQQQEIGHDPGLLAREQRPRAAETGHDLVGDQEDVVARAQLARTAQVMRIVHCHADRPLHERLDDQRGRRRMMLREMRFQRTGRALGDIARGFAGGRTTPIRRSDDSVTAQQRRIGVAEQRHVGHRQGAERLAVIAVRKTCERALVRPAAILPVVEAHLERDLHRARPVGAVERMPEVAGRECGKPFRQLDHRTLRESRKDHMLELVQLAYQRRIDARIRVAEKIHPPRRDGVEIAVAVEIVQPRGFAARDRDDRQRLVHLHLRARMPDRRAAARKPLRIRVDERLGGWRHCGDARAFIRSTAATSSRAMPGSRTE